MKGPQRNKEAEVDMSLLNNICELRKETCSPHESNSQIYVGLEHIDSGRFFLSRHGSPSQVRSTKSRFYPGDVLYGKLRPYLDKAVVAETEGICSTDILVLEPIEVPPWFLCGVLHSGAFIEHAKQTTHGVNHPRTSWSGIKEFETMTFALFEQKKIAAVLLKIQRAIEMQEKIIQSLRNLKKSTMQYLFTHGLRGEKTKMTDIGEIPESWKMSTLGELCRDDSDGTIQTGPFGSQLHASDYQATGVPVVNPTHMLDNRIIHDSIPRVSEKDVRRLARHMLEPGDILFGRRGAIGRHALVNKDEAGWLCGTGCFLVRIRSTRVINSFASWFLYTIQSQEWLLAHAAGSIMPNLNNRILTACPVALPPLDEQEIIVQTLDNLGNKLRIHESKKSVLQDLFKTTLNKLMTGEIRVNDLDIDVSEVEA